MGEEVAKPARRRGYGVLLVAGAIIALDVAWGIALPRVVPWLLENREPDARDAVFWWIGVIDLVTTVVTYGALASGLALLGRTAPAVRGRALVGSALAAGTVLVVGLRMVLPYVLQNPYTEGSPTDWVYRLHGLAVVVLHNGTFLLTSLTLRGLAQDARIKAASTAMGLLVIIGIAMPLWSWFVERYDASWGFYVDRVSFAVLFLVVVVLLRREEATA